MRPPPPSARLLFARREMSSAAAKFAKRLQRDVAAVQEWAAATGQPFEVVERTPGGGGAPLAFVVGVAGPPDTPYAGQALRVRCGLHGFPVKSPSVAFTPPVWHPNVEASTGAVCVDTLRDRWSPCTSLRDVCELILPQLLTDPNPADPFNPEAAAQLRTDKAAFVARAAASGKTQPAKGGAGAGGGGG